ncbi:hypothetical protein NX862_14455 [Rhodobacter sp. KR11]|uniref:hypothetical protein n=1 Tax=Rhodobacter sp. KR11 TaxID=2974588 RepID=UPI002222182E|nr:hypothetical protein [Rhodobacter sp. KR11]MCW1919959.1 hypothetical protein [Rhodobacter sp. KR11]
MTLTPAEKQKRYRERVREVEKVASLAVTDTFRRPFYDYFRHLDDDQSGNKRYLSDTDFDLYLALAGVEAPTFDDDRGPEEFVLNGATVGVHEPFPGAAGSLGRAEVMVGCLLDAAAELASLVGEYKTLEIKARLAEIEASDLSDTETKKAALKEATRLNKMLDQLNKQVRWTLPQWKVTG